MKLIGKLFATAVFVPMLTLVFMVMFRVVFYIALQNAVLIVSLVCAMLLTYVVVWLEVK